MHRSKCRRCGYKPIPVGEPCPWCTKYNLIISHAERKCGRPGCPHYFYPRRRGQEFCSASCRMKEQRARPKRAYQEAYEEALRRDREAIVDHCVSCGRRNELNRDRVCLRGCQPSKSPAA